MGAKKIEVQPIICECGDHAFAAATKGQVVLVDASDADLLRHKWFAKPGSATFYAGRLQNVMLHQVITGERYSDHRNGDGMDNRRRNLRSAGMANNPKNSIRRKRRSSTGYQGVYKRGEGYRAIIRVNKIAISLGQFADLDAAVSARLAAEATYFGEFAPSARLSWD